MLGLIIQAVILIGVIAWLSDEDFSDYEFFDYVKAGLLALGTSILSGAVAVGLGSFVGPLIAVIVGLAVAAFVLGIAIAFLYGVEVPRAMMGAGVYFLVNIILSLGLSALF